MKRNAVFAPLPLAAALTLAFLAARWATPVAEEAAWLGGLVPTLMEDPTGPWWRLLTAPALHVRPGHLIMNLFTLIWTGAAAARLLGPPTLYALFWVGGGVASVASLTCTATWSLGASGANAALVGGLLGLAIRRWRSLEPTHRRLLAVGVAPGLLGLVLFGAAGPTDHAAHLAGLITGLVLGPLPGRRLALAGTAAAIISFGFALLHALRAPPTAWPPPHWVTVQGPAPCTTAFTNGLAFTCAPPHPIPPAGPLPRPYQRFDFTGPQGQARLLFAPATPRTRALLAALAAAPEAGYTPPP